MAKMTVEETSLLMGQFKVRAAATDAENSNDIVMWNDGYLVNIREVDQQHRQLFESMNKVYRHMRNKSAEAETERTLNDLVSVATKHLADEEVLMQKAGYSDFNAHKQVHAKLLTDMDRLVNSYTSTNSEEELLDLVLFFKNWLIDHIFRVDKQYENELHKAGIY